MSVNQNIRYKNPDTSDVNNPEGFLGSILKLKAGYSMLKGPGAPLVSIGTDGDTYIDTDTSTQYNKISGSWDHYHDYQAGTVTGCLNLGGDQGLFNGLVGDDLSFRGLTAGTNVTLTGGVNDITLNVSANPSFTGVSVADGSAADPCIKIGSQAPLKNGFFRSSNDTYIVSNGVTIGYFDPGGTVYLLPCYGSLIGASTPQYTWNSAFNTGLYLDASFDVGLSHGGVGKFKAGPLSNTSLQSLDMNNNAISNISSLNGSAALTNYRQLNVNNAGLLSWGLQPITISDTIVNVGSGTGNTWWGTGSIVSPASGVCVKVRDVQCNIIRVTAKILSNDNWIITGGTQVLDIGYIAQNGFALDANFISLGTYSMPLVNNPEIYQDVNLTLPLGSNLVARIVNTGLTSSAVQADCYVSVTVV